MKKYEFMRKELPYGAFRDKNGETALFNRKYEIIVGNKNIERVEGAWIYSDGNPPWRDKKSKMLCEQVLSYGIAKDLKGWKVKWRKI